MPPATPPTMTVRVGVSVRGEVLVAVVAFVLAAFVLLMVL